MVVAPNRTEDLRRVVALSISSVAAGDSESAPASMDVGRLTQLPAAKAFEAGCLSIGRSSDAVAMIGIGLRSPASFLLTDATECSGGGDLGGRAQGPVPSPTTRFPGKRCIAEGDDAGGDLARALREPRAFLVSSDLRRDFVVL